MRYAILHFFGNTPATKHELNKLNRIPGITLTTRLSTLASIPSGPGALPFFMSLMALTISSSLNSGTSSLGISSIGFFRMGCSTPRPSCYQTPGSIFPLRFCNRDPRGLCLRYRVMNAVIKPCFDIWPWQAGVYHPCVLKKAQQSRACPVFSAPFVAYCGFPSGARLFRKSTSKLFFSLSRTFGEVWRRHKPRVIETLLS